MGRHEDINKGEPAMSVEKNKELVLRFLKEFLGEHKFEVLDELLGPTYTQHNPVIEDSKEGLMGFFKDFWKKHPNTVYHLKRVIAENDLVVIHYLWVVEPGVFERAIVDIFRIENERLVEHWDVVQPMPEKSVNKHPMF
jgi:predicted SnoaL-like aldol condensation-catalyzing enzyme